LAGEALLIPRHNLPPLFLRHPVTQADRVKDWIWSSLEMHRLADPVTVTAYYGNVAISMASEAGLGLGH
jgi:hypothetical protein